MLKRIGISVATLCAAFVLAKPPAAAAADRDDYNNRPSYQQSEGRNSYGGYQSQGRYSYGQYQPQRRYRNDRNSSEWQDRYGYDQRGSTWGDGDHDRDDRRSSEWREHNRGRQHNTWNYRSRNRHESDER
jgi:hypothetical protein